MPLFGLEAVTNEPLPLESKTRRLYYEAYTAAANDINRRMSLEEVAESPRAHGLSHHPI